MALLQHGFVPDLAVFVNGLNDFAYADGLPELSRLLYRFTAPDPAPLPAKSIPTSEAQARSVADNMLARYRRNVSIATGAAAAMGFRAVFVGQPMPYWRYDPGLPLYPFVGDASLWPRASASYSVFEAAALRGEFGASFVWCGDAFSGARAPVYCDPVHYSSEGTRRLGRVILDRLSRAGLWPPASPGGKSSPGARR